MALIGDGALTGGLAYEGLNNAGASGEPLIVILNDNGMSINPNVGAVSRAIWQGLRSKPGLLPLQKVVPGPVRRAPLGHPARTASTTG